MAEDELYPTPDEYDEYTMKESPPTLRLKSGSGTKTKKTAFLKLIDPLRARLMIKICQWASTRCRFTRSPHPMA